MATEMPAQTDSLDTSGPAAIGRAAFGETEFSRQARPAQETLHPGGEIADGHDPYYPLSSHYRTYNQNMLHNILRYMDVIKYYGYVNNTDVGLILHI